jgi:hypothetical protein
MVGPTRIVALAAATLIATASFAACSTSDEHASGGVSTDEVAVETEGVSMATDVCALIDDGLVMTALGTATSTDVGGPTKMDSGTCNWRNTNPNCFLRSLSAEVRSGARIGVEFAALDASAWKHVTIDGLGDMAFSSSEELPVGSAIEIHHLDVLDGETWIRFTLSGRIPSDSSRRVLKEIAAAALA